MVMARKPPPIDSEEASLLYCDEVLAGDGTFLHLDGLVSVRGLDRTETDFVHIFEVTLPKGVHHGT